MCIGRTAFVLVWSVIAISTARADEPLDDSALHAAGAETAQASHRAAVAAYARGHYRDAIDLFLEANRSYPSAAFSFNVARCYEQLDDAPSALAWYRDYLRRSVNASDAAAVGRVIAKLERRLAQKGVQQVSILSTPVGATVAIDGTPVGVSPWTGALAPGVHAVDLTLAGYERASEQFELTPEHARDVTLTLVVAAKPVPAELPARSAVATARQNASPTSDVRDGNAALSTAGWLGLGAGGAALGGALVFEILRRSAEKDAEGEPMQIRFAHDVETMQSRQTVARVLAGMGAALAVVGGVLLIVAGQIEHAPQPQLAFSCTPSKCNASVAGRF